MLVEFATGSDSFPSGRVSQFTARVYNPKTALFVNPRELEGKDAVVRNIKVVQGIPATAVMTAVSTMWYLYRSEAKNGTLWLFELRVKDRSDPSNPFMFRSEYLLVRMHESVGLLKAVCVLPEQEGANMHRLEFHWNGKRITDSSGLSPDERGAFKKVLGVTQDAAVEVTQADTELPSWIFTEVEAARKKTSRTIKTGKKTLGVNRVRRLKL